MACQGTETCRSTGGSGDLLRYADRRTWTGFERIIEVDSDGRTIQDWTPKPSRKAAA